jgi:hypothetical protein
MNHLVRATAVAAATLIAAAGSTTANAESRPAAERFVMTFKTFNGVDHPVHVRATGPIAGRGTETQTDTETPTGEVVDFTWHLRRGTVTAHALEHQTLTFNPAACTAKTVGTGTWTITSATGDYTGATGSGTFSTHGSITGARDANGNCQGPDGTAPPKSVIVSLTGIGTAALPST